MVYFYLKTSFWRVTLRNTPNWCSKVAANYTKKNNTKTNKNANKSKGSGKDEKFETH